MSKTVSVVMCTYNGEKYLREQLDSIIAQTYPIYEIIIQDDGSTDGTTSIVKGYQQVYPYIKFYKNDREHGVNNNFFSAMLKASGDYLAISDQDDIWDKDKLKWQIDAIGNCLLCSVRSVPYPKEGYDTRLPNYSLLRLLYVGNSLPGHTLLFSKRLLSLTPGITPPSFSFSFAKTFDTTLAIVASSYRSVAYVNNPLVLHRMHKKSATYYTPQNNKKTISNICRHIVRDIRLAIELRPAVKRILGNTLSYMQQIGSQEKDYYDAMTMLRLQTSNRFIDFVKLQWFCVKHCEELFFVREKKTMFTMMRAFFFPISQYEYFRYLSKKISY